jgi:hypothetical protein
MRMSHQPEDRGQKTEDRRQRSVVSGRWAVGGGR